MSGNGSKKDGLNDLRRGDVVTVRSLSEILGTLDSDGKCDGMPFMPEMIPFCGKSFPVRRRAEKTCVEGVGVRSLRDAVFLDDLRCDGSAHGGCQRGCLLFWKKAWLRVEGGRRKGEGGRGQEEETVISQCGCHGGICGTPADEAVELPATSLLSAAELPTTRGDRFYCQSTELARATSPFSLGRWQCYLHDLRTGEITLRRLAYILWRAALNRAWRLLRGRPYYELTGKQTQTTAAELDLQPGQWVEVRSAAEIRATLDAKGRNRGLVFDPEMLLYCGRRYRVAASLRNIIVEETGKMAQLSNTVLLEGLTCQGVCARNCPRANYFYWREIWLKRVC
jgi:hypothetical protein